MELFQRATSPWGEDILVRASWDLLWVVTIGAVLFLLVHQVLRRRWIGKQAEAARVEGVPEKVARHSLAARLFHGAMSASMLVLLFTGFLPIVGIQFSWVEIHWWAGLALIATVVFHVVHATVRWSFKEIWVGARDIRDWWHGLAEALGGSGPPPGKPGKYPVDNKLYHHAIVLTSLGAIVTGLLMMVRVETPFWERNPYLLAEGTWGLVYVIHGLSSIALVGLVIAHIYFAILPEKRWMTLAMIYGWIGRRNYLEYYDPERWAIDKESSAGVGGHSADVGGPPPPAVTETSASDQS